MSIPFEIIENKYSTFGGKHTVASPTAGTRIKCPTAFSQYLHLILTRSNLKSLTPPIKNMAARKSKKKNHIQISMMLSITTDARGASAL